jgi:hypothetical protein
VATIRSGMLGCKDWAALAKELKHGPLAPQAAAMASQRRMEGLLEAFNFLVDSSMCCEMNQDAEKEETATDFQPIKLSLYRKPLSGAMQAWSDMEFCIDDTKEPVKVSLKVCWCNGLVFFLLRAGDLSALHCLNLACICKVHRSLQLVYQSVLLH